MAISKHTKAPTKADVSSRTAATPPSAGGAQSPEAVAMRAYEIWRESGCVDGNDQAHWFRAEQELRARTTR